MTYKEAVRQAAEERERRVLDALARGVKVEQIAVDEDISASRVWQIVKEAKAAAAPKAG
jgi:FixJ family two-component response regulator